MDDIRKQLRAAGLENIEDDVILEMQLIEAECLAGTIKDRVKEEHADVSCENVDHPDSGRGQ